MKVEVREFKVLPYSGSVIHFELSEPISPQELPEIVKEFPVMGGEGLIISGRGPIWLYAAVLHKYMHTFAYVAVYDPKLRGAVVVATHLPPVKIGTVIPIEL